MSRIKTLLAEDFELDFDTLEPDYEPTENEVPVEYEIYHALDSDTLRLMDLNVSPQDAYVLREIADRLNMIADKAEVPF